MRSKAKMESPYIFLVGEGLSKGPEPFDISSKPSLLLHQLIGRDNHGLFSNTLKQSITERRFYIEESERSRLYSKQLLKLYIRKRTAEGLILIGNLAEAIQHSRKAFKKVVADVVDNDYCTELSSHTKSNESGWDSGSCLGNEKVADVPIFLSSKEINLPQLNGNTVYKTADILGRPDMISDLPGTAMSFPSRIVGISRSADI